MNCPLCGDDLGEVYASPAMRLRVHLVSKHLAEVDASMEHPAIICCCGQHFRGITSFSRHIAKLQGDDEKAHVVMDSLGQKANTEPRVRRNVMAGYLPNTHRKQDHAVISTRQRTH